MKKTVLLTGFWCFIFQFIPLWTLGQEKDFFDCSEFFYDVKRFNSLEYMGNKSWAKAIINLNKMNQDKAIEWQYVINAQDTIDEKQFMNTIKKWQKQAFTSDKVVKEETERSILFEAYSPQAAFITGYMSATSISVNLLLKIEIKENRFRITGNVNHYNMGSANLSGPESKSYIPGTVYPFEKTNHKESFSMAYINSNARLINLIDSFLKYLNSNYAIIEQKIQNDENW